MLMSHSNLKKQTKTGICWTFFNQFSNYGMQFVIGIIMARLLSPQDYGITALPAVFISLATVFVDSGFGNALIRKPTITEKDLATAFYYSFIIGCVCYAILFTLSPYIANFYNTPILKDLMRVTAITFLWSPLGTPQRIILNRNLDFKTPTKISIVTRLGAGVIGVTFAYCGYGLWALVISSLFSSIASVVLNWIVVRWIPRAGWSKDSFRYLWGYGNKLLASSLLDTAYKNVTPVIIGKCYTPAELGVYNRALGYANLPSQNITQTVRSVTFPVLSKMQDNDEMLAHSYRRMLRTLCFIVFPMMMILAGLARPLVLVMLTSKWESCIIYLQILCFSQMWYPVDAINLNLLQVKGRSDLFLRLEIIKKIIGFIIMAVSLTMGILAFCYGCIVYSLFEIMIDTHYTGKMINVGLFRQFRDILPTILLSFFVFGSLLGIVNVITNLYYQIILGFIVALAIYLGCAFFFKFQELKDVKYMLKR